MLISMEAVLQANIWIGTSWIWITNAAPLILVFSLMCDILFNNALYYYFCKETEMIKCLCFQFGKSYTVSETVLASVRQRASSVMFWEVCLLVSGEIWRGNTNLLEGCGAKCTISAHRNRSLFGMYFHSDKQNFVFTWLCVSFGLQHQLLSVWRHYSLIF